jgi:hypothetical protein
MYYDCHNKGDTMSRLSKFLLFFALLIFILACNFIPQQVKDVQNLAGTAEALASALPFETLQAIPSAVSLETLEAIPSSIPDFEEFNYFDPEGAPLSEWNGIPIMSGATTGEEFNEGTYSFKVSATVQEVQDYYNTELVNLGWSSTFNIPGDENGAIMLFSKDSSLLTVTVTNFDGETVVVLTMG